MPKKKKVVLFNEALAAMGDVAFRGKEGKFIGCCPKCKLTLADWELQDAKVKTAAAKVKCSRCETKSKVEDLVEYVSINNEYGFAI